MRQNEYNNRQKDKSSIALDTLDKKPISQLLTLPTEDLFDLQTKANFEFEKSNYRKKWIEGVIELKYKSTISDFCKKAHDYLESEPLEEMDRYNKDCLVHHIQDKEDIIQVEFYRGYSEIFNKPNVKKSFRLLKKSETNEGRGKL